MTNTDDQIATTTYSDGTTDVLSDWYQVASYSYITGTSLVGTLTLAGGTAVVNRYYGLNGDASGSDDTGSGVTSEYYGDLESTTATRASDSVVLYSATYTYYDAGSVHEGMIHTMSVTELQADDTTISYGATYAYDSYNQLTGVSYSGDWTAGNEAYSFDALGNNTADSPNIMNQPTSANGHALTYDVQGNLTSGPNGETYVYNPLGQLVEADGTNPDSSSYKVVYTYDWAGRMDTRTQWSGTTLQSKTEYVYDGNELIAEYDGLTGRISKSYVWDPTAQNGVGGLLAETVYTYDSDGNQTATRYSVLQNDHGDVTALVNQADGSIAATYLYSATGQVVGGSGDQSLCNFGYDGYYRDNSTGMWIAGQGERLELPGIGFVQPDPAQADLNFYRPWGNAGPNETDPTGLAGVPVYVDPNMPGTMAGQSGPGPRDANGNSITAAGYYYLRSNETSKTNWYAVGAMVLTAGIYSGFGGALTDPNLVQYYESAGADYQPTRDAQNANAGAYPTSNGVVGAGMNFTAGGPELRQEGAAAIHVGGEIGEAVLTDAQIIISLSPGAPETLATNIGLKLAGQGFKFARVGGKVFLQNLNGEIVAAEEARAIIGGARTEVEALNGLVEARNFSPGVIQSAGDTCGLHSAGTIIEELNPAVTEANIGEVYQNLAENRGAGLTLAEMREFLAAHLPANMTVAQKDIGSAETLIAMLQQDQKVIAAVDGNHYVRIIGVVNENGRYWVDVYDSARGNYQQPISAMLNRMYGRQAIVVTP